MATKRKSMDTDLKRTQEIQDAVANMFSLRHVELKCKFIMVGHWFIDVGKITHSYIDSAHMMLSQMGGNVLIFDNDELVADVTGNVLSGVEFRALSDYLKMRFNAEDVLTPVDRAFSKDIQGKTNVRGNKDGED